MPVLLPAQITPDPTQVIETAVTAEAEEHAVGGDDFPSSRPSEPPLFDARSASPASPSHDGMTKSSVSPPDDGARSLVSPVLGEGMTHSVAIVSEKVLGKRPRSASSGSDQDSAAKRIRAGTKRHSPPDVEIPDSNHKVPESASQGENSSAHDEANSAHNSPPNAPPDAASGQEQNADVVIESERDVKIRRITSMFVLPNFSLEEEAEFNGIISRGLTKRSADSFMSVVDKYCFGRLDKPDEAEDLPRRCFMAALLGGKSSPLTGSKASRTSCAKCKHEDTLCCYHLELLPGLATGYGLRLDNGRVDKANGGHQWNPLLEPRTLSRDGRQVRWVAKKR
jgi:hypothetical protein